MKIDKPTADHIVRAFEAMGRAADKIGEAADAVSATTIRAEGELRPARSALRGWGAASWASLFSRITGRPDAD